MRARIKKSGLILFLILFIIIVLHYSKLLSPVEILAVRFLSPFGSGIYNFGQKIQILWRSDISRGDYEKLLEERNKLIVENVELQILKQENQVLREALNFIEENRYNFLAAKIIGRDPLSPNYFILNKGTADGVENNLPVISEGGVLVGKVVKTGEKTSVMLIPTDANFQTAVLILGKSKGNTSGLVRGEKGLGIKMEFIPQDETIGKDDVILTSGLELYMPKGLVIGKVSEVSKEAREIFGEATITPLVSYEDLNIVMVLLPREESVLE